LAAALAAVVVAVALKGVFVPALPQLNLSARVSDRLLQAGLHPRLTQGGPGPLVGFGYQEPSLIFATRSDSALSSLAVAVAQARAGSGFVVLNESLPAFNQALAAKGLRAAPLARDSQISGTNYSKGDRITLVVGRIVAAQQ
jgi:hypothetical protein